LSLSSYHVKDVDIQNSIWSMTLLESVYDLEV